MDNLPMKLDGARILVTNDDGIFAPGIEVLERIAKTFSNDVWVVAPETEQSAASHSLTLRRPLQVREIAAKRYAVNGTPTDCVLVALKKILAEKPADIILSGINRGANLGEDVSYSGTVAAAKDSNVATTGAASPVETVEEMTASCPLKCAALALAAVIVESVRNAQ